VIIHRRLKIDNDFELMTENKANFVPNGELVIIQVLI